MAYYFGFLPSPQLLKMLDDIDEITAPNSKVPYYKHRDLVAHKIAHEMIDKMLIDLLTVIANPERKASMTKVISTVESSTDTLLNLLLTKDDNKQVIPTINFLFDQTLFSDNEGQQRLGFKLDNQSAKRILSGFNAVSADTADISEFKAAIEIMNQEVMTHFVTNFANTLPLGMIKRNSVPIVKASINKGLDIAINRLLPKLDPAGIQRLADFFRPFIVAKSD